MPHRFSGCYTAIVTPFKPGGEVDWEELERLVGFQKSQGVSGIVPVGTTGESPTLSWDEHNRVIDAAFEAVGTRLETIASTGSNSTEESLEATRHAVARGMKAILLVDPYYNGPSSLELRREYYAPIAREFPDTQFIPYIIPGRTGTQLLPQDLALLRKECPNVSGVKEATGSSENARLTRKLCGPDLAILSGDDDKTYSMMCDSAIGSAGVVSVVSNVAPAAVQGMAGAALRGDWKEAGRLAAALQPLFDIVTVKVEEQTQLGPASFKARNPLPIKTVMNVLGMTNGGCRRPLGRMTKGGLKVVVDALGAVWSRNPEVLEPIEGAFDVDVEDRISQPRYREGIAYDDY